MKKLVVGSLVTGAMVLIGGVVAPAHAQGSPPAAPAPSPAPSEAAQPTQAQRLMGDIAPKLAELTDNVLFGDVWERPGLSKRDRSLATVSALVAMNRPDQLRSHLALARENGLTEEELIEAITHLAFYAGWPSAVTAVSSQRKSSGRRDARVQHDDLSPSLESCPNLVVRALLAASTKALP